MKTTKSLLFFFVAAAIMAGCTKATYRKTPGGMPYQLISGGDTQKVVPGNFIKFNFAQKIRDTLVFNSAGKPPIYMMVNQMSNPYDLSELWSILRNGDSIVATQVMDTFIKRNPNGINPKYKKGDRVVSYIKVLAIFKTAAEASADEEKEKKKYEVQEAADLAKYIQDKKINAQKSALGSYVEIKKPGEGSPIDSGKYVALNYNGTSFSGVKFDSSTDSAYGHVTPLTFIVGNKKMIPGLEDAVKLLKKGGVARIYIPSMIGYGPNPEGGPIKPYENLIFDVEILDVLDQAPVDTTLPALTRKKLEEAQRKK